MKFLPLIWAGIWRKPLRTVFTLLSITVAFVLFGLLQGAATSRQHLMDAMRLDRMFVEARFSNVLPMAYLSQVERVPGIKYIAPVGYLGGYYQDPKVMLNTAVMMMDERFFNVYPEFEVIPKDQRAELLRTRAGIIISRKLADRFHWKAGDKIPLHLRYGPTPPTVWDFDILAVTPDIDRTPGGYALGNYDYFDQTKPAADRGVVGDILLRVSDPNQTEQVAQQIDKLFVNSATPVRTIDERTTGQSQQAATFNATFFTQMVVGASFLTLLFLTGNTMMQSVRERTGEFAVWKTLGFTDGRVMALVFAESIVLCAVGAAAGLAIAAAIMPLAQKTIGLAVIPPMVVVQGFGAALLVALVSGLPPSLRANRLSIVDALAGR